MGSISEWRQKKADELFGKASTRGYYPFKYTGKYIFGKASEGLYLPEN